MKDKILKWWNREWSFWEIHSERYEQDIYYNTNWKIITTLFSKSNDGLIKYKTKRNY